MTVNTIYTYGYHGARRSDREVLADLAKKLNAVVVDVRYNPYSSHAVEWNASELEAAVGGDRYIHLKWLGNANYRGGMDAVRLVNKELGMKALGMLLKNNPVILLCMERNPHTCHRLAIAQELAEQTGASIEHLNTFDQKLL